MTDDRRQDLFTFTDLIAVCKQQMEQSRRARPQPITLSPEQYRLLRRFISRKK